MAKLPEEWPECEFTLKNGESFTVDYENVEVGYADARNEFREDKVKSWLVDDGYPTEYTEEDVQSVMVVVKDEHRDTVDELPNLTNLE